MEHEHEADQPSRRKVLKRIGAAGAVAWATPAVAHFGAASAQGTPFNPNPECAPATCSTFVPCSSTNPDCVCTRTNEGGGFCVPGSTSCSVTGDCGPNGECPSGNVCVVDTCCGRPICAPTSLADQCPKDGQPRGQRASTGSGTIGG